MKFTTFIKENKAFCALFSMLLLIAGSLFGYGLYDRLKPPVKLPAVIEESVDTDKEYVDAVISEFGGNYNRSSGEIAFNWNYVEGKNKIMSVILCHGEKELINVTPYRSYNLNRAAYNIPTGDNEFFLRIVQDDEKVIEGSIHVFVNRVVDLEQLVTEKNDKTYVTLRYRYQKGEQIEKPTMIVLDSIRYVDKGHVGTNEREEGDMIVAETTYRFKWSTVEDRPKSFSVRWSFDAINDSSDFIVDVEHAQIVQEDGEE